MRRYGNWKPWVGSGIVLILLALSLIFYIARFNRIDHISIYFAEAAVVVCLILALLGWFPRMRR